jgi:hypothetical protein
MTYTWHIILSQSMTLGKRVWSHKKRVLPSSAIVPAILILAYSLDLDRQIQALPLELAHLSWLTVPGIQREHVEATSSISRIAAIVHHLLAWYT